MWSFCIWQWKNHCHTTYAVVSWIEDIKQTWKVSSQQCEYGRDLSEAGSMFGIRHQWDYTRSPALNLHQISEDKIAENLTWREKTCTHVHAQTMTRQIEGHLNWLYSCLLCPQGHSHRHEETLNASYKLEQIQKHSCCPLYHQSSNKCQPCLCMSAIIVKDNEKYWWLTWFSPCPEHSASLYHHTWTYIKRHYILFTFKESTVDAVMKDWVVGWKRRKSRVERKRKRSNHVKRGILDVQYMPCSRILLKLSLRHVVYVWVCLRLYVHVLHLKHKEVAQLQD